MASEPIRGIVNNQKPVLTGSAERGRETVNALSPTVEKVLRCEDLPLGSLAGRRLVVRWSDGSEGEVLRWYDQEVVVAERELIGKTRAAIRSLDFSSLNHRNL